MPRRRATQVNGDTPGQGLTPQQCTAVDLLTSGKTLTETADAIGVCRTAVSAWVNHDAAFIAALNARRQEAFDAMVETLRGLLPKALDVLKKELDGPQPLPAAIQILKSCGLHQGIGRPAGPATVVEAEQEQIKRQIQQTATLLTPEDVELAEKRREGDRAFAALTAFS